MHKDALKTPIDVRDTAQPAVAVMTLKAPFPALSPPQMWRSGHRVLPG